MPVDPTVLQDLHDRLGQQLTALTTGDEWLAFLRSSRQFHRYSPQNQMLLVLQGATGHVASYRTWQRLPAVDGGRCQVRRGETGLVILAPMTLTHREVDKTTGEEITVGRTVTRFKPVKVFHQAQLVAPPDLAEPPLPKLLSGDNRHQHVWAAVQSHLEDLGYDVELVSRSPVETWNGRTDFAASHVAVSDHLEPPARLKTLLHEWAHIALRHDERLVGQRDLQEVEAESVAYLMCAAIGLDSAEYSVPYLADWASGDSNVLEATAQRVLAATAELVNTLENELSIDLTPDLLRLADGAAVAAINADASEPRRSPLHLVAGGDAPRLDAAHGELRAVMAGLVGEDERQRLLDALDDVDHQLAIAVDLCQSAGFSPERTARFLLVEQHVPVEALMPAMIQDELDHYPSAPNVPPNIQRYAAAYIRDIIEDVIKPTPSVTEQQRPETKDAAAARLAEGDRELLHHMDLTRRDHLTQAVRLLHDAGLGATEAGAVLQDLGVPASSVDSVVDEPQYDPATGRHAPLWPPEKAVPPSPDEPAPNLTRRHEGAAPVQPDPQHAAPPVSVVLRVAATGDPQRLVQLSEAFGLRHDEAVQLWANSGVPADLAARSALAARNGDPTAALADLDEHWSGQPVEWTRHLDGTSAATRSAAHGIVRQWADMRPNGHPTPTPEMA